MPGIVIALAVLAGLLILRHLGRMPAGGQRQFQRQALGLAMVVGAAVLALKGQLLIAVPLLGFGAGLLGWQNLPFQKTSNSAPPVTTMDRSEALNVLGLKANATVDDIRAAHKNLLRGLHPDAGGSTYLSAKINAARDKLIK